ncbi:MAG: hypothetical protein Q9157_007809, partial [Trypethelium eluteriae]
MSSSPTPVSVDMASDDDSWWFDFGDDDLTEDEIMPSRYVVMTNSLSSRQTSPSDPRRRHLSNRSRNGRELTGSQQQTGRFWRRRRLSRSQASSKSSSSEKPPLTLEHLLPRQPAREDRTPDISTTDASLIVTNGGEVNDEQNRENNSTLNPGRLGIGSILRRTQRQLFDDPNLRSTRYGRENWVSNPEYFATPTGHRQPSALILYQLGQGQTRSSDNPLQAAKASYLPLCLVPNKQMDSCSPLVKPIKGIQYMRQPNMRSQVLDQLCSIHWPQGRIPVELFEQITDYLSRDDIKNMRLVNQEFEYGVSAVLFKTAVVPFNTEIYDMIESETTVKPNLKGKGIAYDLEAMSCDEDPPGTLPWKNRKKDEENKVYKGHGLRVFSGFGPRIRKYGMSFEVEEDALATPPQKNLLKRQVSFWGGYEWPHEQYRRFADRAGLEQAADETSKMKQAFSHLHRVQELALSVDSGLGWLRGPDVSIRSTIFKRPPPVFGSSKRSLDRIHQEQEDIWQALQTSNRVSRMSKPSFMAATLYRHDIAMPLEQLPDIGGSSHADTSVWPLMESRLVSDARTEKRYQKATTDYAIPPGFGVLYAHSDTDDDECDEVISFKKHPLTPRELTKEQKEWLLETEWAQRAFMMSYMLAVVDNPTIFTRVHTLNLSRISSRYVLLLDRPDFWAALPQLRNIIIRVIPDWRNCSKDNLGAVRSPAIDPSSALTPFNKLLYNQIRKIQSVVSLTLGWISGGEHGEGMYARNQQLLPAPVMLPRNPASAQNPKVVKFPFVKHLTISNCWITPPALVAFVKRSRDDMLEKLTCDSVSLTARPSYPSALDVMANMQVAGQQNAQVFIPGQNPGQGQLVAIPNLQHAQTIAAHFQAQFQQGNLGALPQFQNPANGIQLWQGGQPAVAPWPQAQNPNVHPNLPNIVQTMQQQQQMLAQQQMAPAFQAPALQQPWQPPPAPHHNAPGNASNDSASRREGSWPDVINRISPGRKLPKSDSGSNDEEDDAANIGASSATKASDSPLRALEFISCGYCHLANPPWNQNELEPPDDNEIRHRWDPCFQKRYDALSPCMMLTRDRSLGTIVQYMPESELNTMAVAWGMRTGWEDAKKAEEVEFDG